jgi:hypothetical protein
MVTMYVDYNSFLNFMNNNEFEGYATPQKDKCAVIQITVDRSRIYQACFAIDCVKFKCF